MSLGAWLEHEGFAEARGAGAIADVVRVRSELLDAARAGRSLSYSELLQALGFRFTRPKMRALCRTLDAIDAGRAPGEPALAVLVVREGDGLPGQGWWTSAARHLGYAGSRTGADAIALVRDLQQQVFDHWRDR